MKRKKNSGMENNSRRESKNNTKGTNYNLEKLELRKRGQIFVLIITIIAIFASVICGLAGLWQLSLALLGVPVTASVGFYIKSIQEG